MTATTTTAAATATKRIVSTLLGVAGLLALPTADAAGAGAASPLVTGAAGGARVSVRLVPEPGGATLLQVTIAPQSPGFHIYSLALPPTGVDGLGVPTRIDVRGGLAATAGPAADEPTRYLRPAGLNVELPVYPDGAVTFAVPVTRRGDGPGEVVVSYGLCSAARCMVPVEGLAIGL